jgi:hypothetical protein
MSGLSGSSVHLVPGTGPEHEIIVQHNEAEVIQIVDITDEVDEVVEEEAQMEFKCKKIWKIILMPLCPINHLC